MFFNDWLYFGVLTILLEAIIYLAVKLAKGELDTYRKNKFLKENPEIASLLDEAEGMEVDATVLDEMPLVSYLVYPKNLKLSTGNTAVLTTQWRAEEFADTHDEILQVMFYPPTKQEQDYHRTAKARMTRAQALYKLFITEENSDDESST